MEIITFFGKSLPFVKIGMLHTHARSVGGLKEIAYIFH